MSRMEKDNIQTNDLKHYRLVLHLEQSNTLLKELNAAKHTEN